MKTLQHHLFVALFLSGLVLLVLLLGFSRRAQAQVPQRLNYQGVLTDHAGDLVEDHAYRVTFRLYDDEDAAGQALWSETQTVPVHDGLLSTMIGAEQALNLPFDRPYYLTVQLEGQAESDPMPLSAAAYALVARDVPDSTVVRSISGLRDAVELVAGEGIAIQQHDNQLIISAAQGFKGYGPAETAYAARSATKKAGGVLTEAQDEARLQELMGTLGPGGSNTGLDAAYDAGRIVTLDDGRISLRGDGRLGLELRDADMITRDGLGGNPNVRFRVDGASTLQVYRIELDAASGEWRFANSTASTVPFRMTKDAPDGLLSLDAAGLNVDGTATVSGLKMATGATNGRVLTSDASGNASWQTPSTPNITSGQCGWPAGTNNCRIPFPHFETWQLNIGGSTSTPSCVATIWGIENDHVIHYTAINDGTITNGNVSESGPSTIITLSCGTDTIQINTDNDNSVYEFELVLTGGPAFTTRWTMVRTP